MKPRGRLDFLLLVKFISLIKFKGTKTEFANQLTTREYCSTQSKYNFLNKMLDIGVLVPTDDKVKWGEEGLVIYKVDKKKCKNYFKSTEEGQEIFKFVDETTLLID